MAQWTLLHLRNPLITTAGTTGSYGELTKATSRKFTFSTEDPATLSFDMPGALEQTSKIEPLVSDVLAFRDDTAVQRFRVVSREMTKESGVVTASFTAVAYRALLDAWILDDADTRSFTNVEQTDIAWTLISQQQAKGAISPGDTRSTGYLGISRGSFPTTAVLRSLIGSVDDTTSPGPRPEYFASGMQISEAVNNVSNMINGFEWDIEPDVNNPYTLLKFNTWNYGQRSKHAIRSPLVLDDGGSLLSWSHTVTPTDYGNVIRFSGADSADGTTTPLKVAWVPSTKEPTLFPPEGRWVRDINNSDLTTQASVDSYAPKAYETAHTYVPEIGCTLARGRWQGPDQLWLGDYARFIVSVPVVGKPGVYTIYVDEDVRVVEIDIDVDDLGAEDVSLSLNRPKYSTNANARQVNDRLNRLERR